MIQQVRVRTLIRTVRLQCTSRYRRRWSSRFPGIYSDNDGIHDLAEGSGFDPAIVDVNNDGVIDDNNTDADRDGIPDWYR